MRATLTVLVVAVSAACTPSSESPLDAGATTEATIAGRWVASPSILGWEPRQRQTEIVLENGRAAYCSKVDGGGPCPWTEECANTGSLGASGAACSVTKGCSDGVINSVSDRYISATVGLRNACTVRSTWGLIGALSENGNELFVEVSGTDALTGTIGRTLETWVRRGAPTSDCTTNFDCMLGRKGEAWACVPVSDPRESPQLGNRCVPQVCVLGQDRNDCNVWSQSKYAVGTVTCRRGDNPGPFVQAPWAPQIGICVGDPLPNENCPTIDVSTDPKNCGACGRDCGGSGCSAGQCEPAQLAYWGIPDAGGRAPDGSEGSGEALAVDDTHVFWRHDNTGEVERVEKSLGTRQSISKVLGDVRSLFPVAGDFLYYQGFDVGIPSIMRVPKTGGAHALVHQLESFSGNLSTDGTSFFWSRYQPLAVDSVPIAGGTAVRVMEAKDCVFNGETGSIKMSTSKYMVVDRSTVGLDSTLCSFAGAMEQVPDLRNRGLTARYGDSSFWQNASSVRVVFGASAFGSGSFPIFPITPGNNASAGKQGLHIVRSGQNENEIVRYSAETGTPKVLARFMGKPLWAMVEDDDWIYFSTLEALYRLRK